MLPPTATPITVAAFVFASEDCNGIVVITRLLSKVETAESIEPVEAMVVLTLAVKVDVGIAVLEAADCDCDIVDLINEVVSFFTEPGESHLLFEHEQKARLSGIVAQSKQLRSVSRKVCKAQLPETIDGGNTSSGPEN